MWGRGNYKTIDSGIAWGLNNNKIIDSEIVWGEGEMYLQNH